MKNIKKMLVRSVGLGVASAVFAIALPFVDLSGTGTAWAFDDPQYGGALHINSRDWGPTNWDPFIAFHITAFPAYDGWLRHDPLRGPLGTGEYTYSNSDQMSIGALTGSLVESWERVDTSNVILKIRKGIQFFEESDVPFPNPKLKSAYGTEFNAHTIIDVWNITSKWEKAGEYGRDKDYTLTATDDWTVEIKFAKPNATEQWIYDLVFTWVFGHPEMWHSGVNRNDFKNALGTGPFIPLEEVEGNYVEYKKNPTHWAVDPFIPENKLPYIDRLRLVLFDEFESQVAALRTGKLDFIYKGLSKPNFESLRETNPELGWTLGGGDNRHMFVRVDLGPPWDDIRVRKAAMYAINHPEIDEVFFEGVGEYPNYPAIPGLAPDFIGYDMLKTIRPDLAKLFEHHPEEAKALLAEAGYPNGFDTVLATPPRFQEAAEIFANYMREVGIRAELKVLEEGLFYAATIGIGQDPDDEVYSGMTMSDSGSPNTGLIFSLTIHTDPRGQYFWSGRPWDQQKGEWKPGLSEATIAEGEKLMRLFDELKLQNDPVDYRNKWVENYLAVYETLWALPGFWPRNYNMWQPWVHRMEGQTPVYAMYGYLKYFWVDCDLKKERSGRDCNE